MQYHHLDNFASLAFCMSYRATYPTCIVLEQMLHPVDFLLPVTSHISKVTVLRDLFEVISPFAILASHLSMDHQSATIWTVGLQHGSD